MPLLISVLVLATTTAGYLVPGPPNKHNVTLTTGSLIDNSRNISNTTSPRELMLSVFQPATCTSTVDVPYMPNKTAMYQGPYLEKQFSIPIDLTPLFLEARLPVCSPAHRGCSPQDGPVLILSPGYGIPRLYYSVIASAISSKGFTVITVDHPGDANIISYPDGHAVYLDGPSSPTPDEYNQYMEARVADVSFIIDQLSNAKVMAELLPRRGFGPFPTDRIAILGHSLGGAAAVLAAGRDDRLRAAINWDGSFFGTLSPSGVSQPVLYMSEDNATDPTWVDLWPQLHGPKLWLTVANTTHESFSDIPTLLQASGQRGAADLAGLLGSIAPAELVEIMAEYTAEWMGGAFSGKIGGPLLSGQEPRRFPEVSITQKSNY